MGQRCPQEKHFRRPSGSRSTNSGAAGAVRRARTGAMEETELIGSTNRITPENERKCRPTPGRYHRSMSIRKSLLQFILCLAAAAAAAAQTTTVPAGLKILSETGKNVTGVRVVPQPDGTVWFLLPSIDRIVQLQADGATMKQWQIRADSDLGANPVDLKVDGKIV